MKSNASRLLRIMVLEKELQASRDLQRETQSELDLKGRMMATLLCFRDKQLTADMADLIHENSALRGAAERWKERARNLGQERRGLIEMAGAHIDCRGL